MIIRFSMRENALLLHKNTIDKGVSNTVERAGVVTSEDDKYFRIEGFPEGLYMFLYELSKTYDIEIV